MSDNESVRYVGEIIMFPRIRQIDGWLLCDGTVYDIAQFFTLFSVIGNAYGGDGRTTFAVPDLRGVLPLGATPAAPPGYRTNPYDANFNGTINQPVTPSNLPALSAGFTGIPMALSGSLKVKATPAQGGPTPQTNYVLGNGGGGSGSANIYVPPSSATNPLTLDGGTVQVTGTPQGSVSVNPGGRGVLPIKVPALSFAFFIAVEGIYPPLP